MNEIADHEVIEQTKQKANGQVVNPNKSHLDTYLQTPQSKDVDAKALAEELSNKIQGEVRFDNGSRALYATDASNYRQVPIGVVLPKTEQDILTTLELCRKYHAPVLSRGGGTSLAGQCCNVAVVMDMSKYYNSIIDIDPEKKLVTVQPGIVLDHMRNPISKQHNLTFGPDPATHDHCTIGGMLGNNSCGVHSVMAQFHGDGARTSDNVERMTIVTYDGVKMEVGPTSEDELENIIRQGGRKGEIYKKLRALRDKYEHLIRDKFPNIPRRVSGYNLPDLLPENGFNVAKALVGTEGTCVTILEATLKLIPNPKKRSLVLLGYNNVYEAGNHIMQILKHEPVGLEGIDHLLIEYMQKKDLNMDDLPLLPDGKAWLLVEFGGDTKDETDEKARKMMEELKREDDAPNMSLFDDPKQEQKVWEIRESGLGATAWVPGERMRVPGWEDTAVPPETVGDYLKDLRKLFHKYGYNPSLYGHFGQGCIHCRVGFDLLSEEGLENYKNFTREAAHLVVDYGGTLSGEHGDGQSRGELLEIMYGKELVLAFREFKSIWDPEWKMNPGKVVDPFGQMENLRLSPQYNPPKKDTYFQFPGDNNNFAQATLRCVGVGKCRRSEGGTMCPSYKVTREEADSTRGRARLLFEMLQGDAITNGWKEESVKESLDLCLACKGCKGDCPVNVDMATYKAEFLSHYYKGKLRPRSAYAFGWIYWWAQLASVAPSIANFFTQRPGFNNIAKFMAGVAPERQIPKFAPQTFRNWFKKRKNEISSDPKVILWPDTFNNFFLPGTLKAGTTVLKAAGYDPVIPKQMLCCGRPLYDFGMLKTAKKLLKEILDALREDIRQGTPVVGFEPSCVAVFRDELCNLFPNDQDAQRLKEQTYTLAEFLQKYAEDWKMPRLEKKAIIHGHCHHKAIMKMDEDEKVLQQLGLDYELLNSGCCGMAGYFGYEKGEHYDVSVKAGEIVLMPAVREADDDTLIIADGFSCREQIQQQSQRHAVHLAEVLEMGLNEG